MEVSIAIEAAKTPVRLATAAHTSSLGDGLAAIRTGVLPPELKQGGFF
jgi:hypothetical protein